ncbi:MAG: hypothetical protein KA779_05335 [Propionivibrio sp.]|nr:hypothetical protein [Propionivibrio sp.]
MNAFLSVIPPSLGLSPPVTVTKVTKVWKPWYQCDTDEQFRKTRGDKSLTTAHTHPFCHRAFSFVTSLQALPFLALNPFVTFVTVTRVKGKYLKEKKKL